MPNTLAHVGVQVAITRGLIKQSDLRFILLGCIIPDLPWIVQRLVVAFGNIDPYQLRSYAVAQAALFMCVPISLAFACITKQKLKTFAILLMGCSLHLLLDSTQTKWANGVHLWAPFNWQLLNLGWYWPESAITYLLSALGLVMVGVYWRGLFLAPLPIQISARNIVFSLVFGAVYLTAPVLFIDAVSNADSHYVTTLSDPDRSGKYVEFDRRPVLESDAGAAQLKGIAGEKFTLDAALQAGDVVSVKGQFESPFSVHLLKVHHHRGVLRDWLSYAGLLLVLLSFMVPLLTNPNTLRTPAAN